MLAIYVIGSLAALLVSGRWLRSLGKGGLETDPARSIEERLSELETAAKIANERRDELARLLEVMLRG